MFGLRLPFAPLHALLATIFQQCRGQQGLCSFARNRFGDKPCRPLLVCSQVIWRKRWPRSAGTVRLWQATPMTCLSKQDDVMPYLLKPSGSPDRPPHGIRFAGSDVVAKRKIEQLLANGSGAGRWPGRCRGYGWLLSVMRSGRRQIAGRRERYGWLIFEVQDLANSHHFLQQCLVSAAWTHSIQLFFNT